MAKDREAEGLAEDAAPHKRVKTTTGLVIISGALAVRAYNRRRKARKGRKRRFIPRKMRAAMGDSLKTVIGGIVTEGGETEAFLDRRVDKLTDKQLVALWSLYKAGHFAKESGIDPAHPTKDQVVQAAVHYLAAAGKAPSDREALLEQFSQARPEELEEAIALGADILAEEA